MNRKKQLLGLILAKISKMRTQELKEVRDFVISLEISEFTRKDIKEIIFDFQDIKQIIKEHNKNFGKHYFLADLDQEKKDIIIEK